MPATAIVVRCIGMLPSGSAEAAALASIRVLDAACPDVTRWDVSMRPPVAAPPLGAYAVRAQAHLADGGTVAMRAQANELLAAVREAFEGVGELLRQEYGATCSPQHSAWASSDRLRAPHR